MLDIEKKSKPHYASLYGSLRILPETDPGWENDTPEAKCLLCNVPRS